MLKTVMDSLGRFSLAKWLWGAWFISAGGVLLTDWEGFKWGSKWMVYLFAGTLLVGLSLMVVLATWDTATKALRWIVMTKEQREEEKAARKIRRVDAPFDHWEPPTGRD
ncbi:hypothetical protein [Pseudomonas solani]|uniref:hypothetical protein n=1 Tax=Pseudomonas solani TaxID=2731552 RepID=UPI003C2E6019